ncbi:VOC family protein [Nonomuraea sp. NPDC050790]|uniref:VOC family protein n=1 Tax=Nonomuraea sp. NPDC050790 TaxID=3364371 RepID=UPI003794C19B
MSVKAIPEGYTTVTPWIISRDTAAVIDYLRNAFDAEELGRVIDARGVIGHAEVRIGDAIVMLFDGDPSWPATPAFLRLYVEDARAVHRQAVEAGGVSISEVTHLAFGDLVGRVRDPFGNVWWIQTHIEDVTPEEMQRRFTDPTFTAAMEYMQRPETEIFPRTRPPQATKPTRSHDQLLASWSTAPLGRGGAKLLRNKEAFHRATRAGASVSTRERSWHRRAVREAGKNPSAAATMGRVGRL